MYQTVIIEASSYKEATTNLKDKVKEIYEGLGRGRNQQEFYCKVVGYRVIKEVKPFIEFKKPQVFND